MQKKTEELIKKFEQDYEINVGVTETLTSWTVFAQIQEKSETGFHTRHIGKRYVTGPNANGKVQIFSDPRNSEAYTVESWGKMELCDEFVEKALARILVDRDAADN
ncbi:hypothetical protein [Methanoregula sp.]|jgi:hypothetical protein|uniref:hypothetical protein n=1 Tax=Methanoregula sp. TaxID=2052170 RepID=UPI003562631F